MLLVVLVWCFSNNCRFPPPKNNGVEKRKPEEQLNKQHKHAIFRIRRGFLFKRFCLINAASYFTFESTAETNIFAFLHNTFYFLSNLCLLDDQFSDLRKTCVQLSAFPTNTCVASFAAVFTGVVLFFSWEASRGSGLHIVRDGIIKTIRRK